MSSDGVFDVASTGGSEAVGAASEISPTTASAAIDIRDSLAAGSMDAVQVVGMCLAQIEKREPEVQAWAWLDSDHALKQAEIRDAERRSGNPIGSLHGVPVGLKDIIDTAGIPTQNGTVLDEGRLPGTDSFVVERLKQAGAIILGKTVSTELAFLAPSKTRNPHNLNRTPGGSSSGSAAAVACGMVPVAVGTQTGGSVIRPAAFCGVTGFKPTFGRIPRTGILNQSASLDTVGVFGRTVADVAMVADALFGYHEDDSATSIIPHARLLDIAVTLPPVAPTFAFVKTPFWAKADEPMQFALQQLADMLGEQCFEAQLPDAFADSLTIRARINQAEMAKNFLDYRRSGDVQLSSEIKAFMNAGDKVLAKDYLSGLDWPAIYNADLEMVFERCDAILTPATTGAAPGLETTGDAVFNGLWTFCGTPAITLPLFSAEDGMPMGVQLVGRCGDDARLLRTARWLEGHVASL